jgi:hypothetical protein
VTFKSARKRQRVSMPNRVFRRIAVRTRLRSPYYLYELVDVGLINKRQQTDRRQPGFYMYSRPTAMGRGILGHDIEELMRRERGFNDTYS